MALLLNASYRASLFGYVLSENEAGFNLKIGLGHGSGFRPLLNAGARNISY